MVRNTVHAAPCRFEGVTDQCLVSSPTDLEQSFGGIGASNPDEGIAALAAHLGYQTKWAVGAAPRGARR